MVLVYNITFFYAEHLLFNLVPKFLSWVIIKKNIKIYYCTYFVYKFEIFIQLFNQTRYHIKKILNNRYNKFLSVI